MTFDEWWGSLSTRDQNSTDRQLTKAAWQVSAMLMQERCAYVADTTASGRDAEAIVDAIRALGDLEMPCHTEMTGVRPAKTIRALGD